MKLAVRLYSDHDLSDADAGAMLREALTAMTDRIREGFRGGVVTSVLGETLGEWQYERTEEDPQIRVILG